MGEEAEGVDVVRRSVGSLRSAHCVTHHALGHGISHVGAGTSARKRFSEKRFSREKQVSEQALICIHHQGTCSRHQSSYFYKCCGS